MTSNQENPGTYRSSSQRTGNDEFAQGDHLSETSGGRRWFRSPTLLALSVILGLGTLYLILALRLPFGSLQKPQFGFFPTLVGFVLIVSSAVAILQQLLAGEIDTESKEIDSNVEESSEEPSNSRWKVAVILAAMFVYVLIADIVGHILTVALVTAVAIKVAGGRPWWQTLIYGSVIALGTYLVFVWALNMPLPEGPAEGLL